MAGTNYIGGLLDWIIEAAKGSIPYHETYRKWGRNPDIDVAASEFVWEFGGNYTWQTVADEVVFTSTSTADDASGTGWDTVQVFGLDANFDRQTEYLQLNGQGNATTLRKYILVYRVNALAPGTIVGTGEVNAGDITGTFQGTGDVAAFCAAGDGGTMQMFDIVPNGYTLFITGFSFGSFRTASGQDSRIVVGAFIQLNGLGKTLIREDVMDTTGTSHVNVFIPVPFRVPEKTRLWLEATTDQDNTRLSASIQGILVKNI